MGFTTRKRVLASALVAALVLAICDAALANDGEPATAETTVETVVVFPLRHSGEAEQSDVEFLDNIVLAGFEKLPRDRFSVAVGDGGGTEFCDEGCVDLQLRQSGGDYAVHGEIERRDSGFFVNVWLVRIGDEIEQLGREEIGGETVLSALVGPLTTVVDILRARVASSAEPKAGPVVAKKKTESKAGTKSKAERARRQALARHAARLRAEYEDKRTGSGVLITFGVLCAVGAFGLGFAYGYTGEVPFMIAGGSVEALGIVLIVSGSVMRARANRGLAKIGFARLSPGDAWAADGGFARFDRAASRLASSSGVGIAFSYEF